MVDLERYTPDELEAARAHLREIEAYAAELRRREPGAGWEPVMRLLSRDMARLDEALYLATVLRGG